MVILAQAGYFASVYLLLLVVAGPWMLHSSLGLFVLSVLAEGGSLWRSACARCVYFAHGLIGIRVDV